VEIGIEQEAENASNDYASSSPASAPIIPATVEARQTPREKKNTRIQCAAFLTVTAGPVSEKPLSPRSSSPYSLPPCGSRPGVEFEEA
jgi:hypothetical protein